MPGRISHTCGRWLYGKTTDAWEEGEVDEGFGAEVVDDPRVDAPDGMGQAEYDSLNPAEKALAWTKFWTLSREDFGKWMEQMRLIRSRAEAWARSIAEDGAHNGRQDALRHAFWQCSMTKAFGSVEARAWGDAHEKYSTEVDEVRMDLWNNAAGRHAAGLFDSCESGILAALHDGSLKLGFTPPPGWGMPFTPEPPRPPQDS